MKYFLGFIVAITCVFIVVAFYMYNSHLRATAISALGVYEDAEQYLISHRSYGFASGNCNTVKSIFVSDVIPGKSHTLSFAGAVREAENILGETATCFAEENNFAVSIKYSRKYYYCVDSHSKENGYTGDSLTENMLTEPKCNFD
ncbi:hypothetical protein KC865_00370 [Candidatus Kaiserbacteria bacterium]|nr:hypothetical protein [Candidatus Kaiserbacteria bacterium]USN92399.1 MAG: hypothetical protein H6782_01125 [Candidatus Nomurabacteria bacterium]